MEILFLDEVHPILAERLEKAGHNCIHAEELSLETCQELANKVDGIVIRSRFPMNDSFLKFAPNLKFIARSGAGMENIDIPYCESRNITLFNSPEGNRNAVAEHALGMLLSLMNNLEKIYENTLPPCKDFFSHYLVVNVTTINIYVRSMYENVLAATPRIYRPGKVYYKKI